MDFPGLLSRKKKNEFSTHFHFLAEKNVCEVKYNQEQINNICSDIIPIVKNLKILKLN